MKNTFKKIAALVLAIACVMSITISASAANTTVPDGTAVCADIYFPVTEQMGLINATAHLNNPKVPPVVSINENNTSVQVVGGKMRVVFTLVNKTFVIDKTPENVAKFATAGGLASTNGGAKIIDVQWEPDTKRPGTGAERAASITFEFDSLNTEYVFEGIDEYANDHPFVRLHHAVGPKHFDLRFKVVQK